MGYVRMIRERSTPSGLDTSPLQFIPVTGREAEPDYMPPPENSRRSLNNTYNSNRHRLVAALENDFSTQDFTPIVPNMLVPWAEVARDSDPQFSTLALSIILDRIQRARRALQIVSNPSPQQISFNPSDNVGTQTPPNFANVLSPRSPPTHRPETNNGEISTLNDPNGVNDVTNGLRRMHPISQSSDSDIYRVVRQPGINEMVAQTSPALTGPQPSQSQQQPVSSFIVFSELEQPWTQSSTQTSTHSNTEVVHFDSLHSRSEDDVSDSR